MKSLASILFLMSLQASALTIDDFKGQWQELGYRCEGDSDFKPRDNSFALKFLTINDGGAFIHRVDMPKQEGCPYIKSEGTLEATEQNGYLDITAHAHASLECKIGENSKLADDFSLMMRPLPMKFKLDTIQGATYMIIGGVEIYKDKNCANPFLERVYGKIQKLSEY